MSAAMRERPAGLLPDPLETSWRSTGNLPLRGRLLELSGDPTAWLDADSALLFERGGITSRLALELGDVVELNWPGFLRVTVRR
jgi:hypothetical protein